MKNKCIITGGVQDGITIPFHNDKFYIAADSGIINLQRNGITPDLIIGDFDSYTGALPENAEKIKLPGEKNDTDTIAAVKEGLFRGYKEFELYGVIGGRFDHTFAAVQTLSFIDEQGGRGKIFTPNDVIFTLSSGAHTLTNTPQYKFISLFSLTEKTLISTEGLKYDLYEYTHTENYPLGVSNEFTGTEAKLRIKSGKLLVVFSNE
ncbi:MAG: thiamine diphosphokinase [Ruminococcus sp.]|jgi:thiamine pyrophosphokinase|nr:thiamine diphosphokinase [Ruminococcus sp.]